MTSRNNGQKKTAISAKKVTDPCPYCGVQLVHQEGITVCHNCGYEGPR